MIRSVPLALAFWLAAGMAHAHIRSESHSAWVISGANVYLSYTVPDLEAKRLAAADAATATDTQLTDYLEQRVGVDSATGKCPLTEKPHVLVAAPGYRKIDFTFECPDAKILRLHSSAFFDLVASHVNLAQVQLANGELIEQLLTQDHHALEPSGGAENRLQNADFFEYVLLGIMHIFTGVDHQSFLLGLILISRRFRDLVFVVTGFTLGHSITLALAVTGVVQPHAEYIDALIGLTIALIGAENAVVATRRPGLIAGCGCALLIAMAAAHLVGLGGLPTLLLLGAGIFSANYLMISGHLQEAGRLRLIVTLVFGLIHGFGFAANLLEMRLPAGRITELLFGFNLGVEIGQLTLVVIVLALIAALKRYKLTLPRPIVVDVGSAFLVGVGLFWFVGRSYA